MDLRILAATPSLRRGRRGKGYWEMKTNSAGGWRPYCSLVGLELGHPKRLLPLQGRRGEGEGRQMCSLSGWRKRVLGRVDETLPHPIPAQLKQNKDTSDKQGCSLPSTLPKGGSLPLPLSRTAALGENIHTVEGGMLGARTEGVTSTGRAGQSSGWGRQRQQQGVIIKGRPSAAPSPIGYTPNLSPQKKRKERW